MQTGSQRSGSILYIINGVGEYGELYIKHSGVPSKSRLTVPVIPIVRLMLSKMCVYAEQDLLVNL